MSELSWQSEWFTWGLVLICGFPLLVILLGEVIHRMQQQSHSLTDTLKFIRSFVLPVLVFLIFIQNVLGLDPEGNFVKVAQTLFWICGINAALSLINVFLFSRAEVGSWRARMPKLLIDLARLLLILLGTAIVLSVVWNADLAGLVTALGVGSVVIGLALQDTVGSVMSGIALLFERPFNVGDWLQVGETTGQVVDINWRAVRLKADSEEIVVLPHQLIGGETIRNFSQPSSLYAESFLIGFSYDDPPNLVKQVLKNTALETAGVLSNPEPKISTTAHDESAITYEVKFYTADFDDDKEARDDFLTRIWYAARRNNLKPYRLKYEVDFDAHTHNNGTAQKLVDSLKAMPIFMPLAKDATHLKDLVNEVPVLTFGTGEKIVREGSLVDTFYIVISGQAVLTVIDSYGKAQEILTLAHGEFFGTIALSTLEPSQVSVTAVTDLEVIAIHSDVISRIFQNQPSLAREIAQLVEARRKAIALAKQEDGSLTLNSPSSQSTARWMLNDLLRQISYFQKFNDTDLRYLIDQGYRKTLSSGDVICKENDPGDSFYIILYGSVEVFVESIGKRVAIRRTGEFIGEMSLLLGIPRTATLRALGKTILFVVDHKNLQSLLKKHQNLADQISEELAKRQETLERVGIKVSSDNEEETAATQVRKRIQSIFGI